MPLLVDLPPVLWVSVAVALGATFGSFLNVVVHRLPRGESVVYPGSRCPHCNEPIHAVDNIPIVSYLVLRGRSRCCGRRISFRYLLLECLGALYAWALTQTVVAALPADVSLARATGVFALALALGLTLIAAALIDMSHMYLPDGLTLGGLALGLATAGFRPNINWWDALLGAAVGFLMVWLPFDRLYRILRGRVGMGLGDAKLVALAGAWFGWKGALFALLAGAVQGTAVTLAVWLARGRIEEPEAVSRERAERMAEIERAEGDERAKLQEEFASDPVLVEPPTDGLGQARLAFGPFLVLAILEFQLFGESWLARLYAELIMGS